MYISVRVQRVVRLVNVSKFECRLSLRPPARRELAVQLCAARGLTLSSGATLTLKIHFRYQPHTPPHTPPAPASQRPLFIEPH